MGNESDLAGVIISFLTMNMRQAAITRDHIEDDFAAFEFETEIEFVQACPAHCLADRRFVLLAIEHQKSASAGAADFSSDGASLLRHFVPGVDLVAADAAGQSLLGLPVNIQKLAEMVKVSADNCVSNVDADALDLAQALDDTIAFLLGVGVLLFKNPGSITSGSSVEQEHIAFERLQKFHAQAQASGVNPAIFLYVKCGQAAERGHVLILLSNWLAQPVEFDMASFLGQPFGTGGRLGETVHGIEQTHQVTTGGAQTCAGGNIRDRDDFDAILDMKMSQRLAGKSVLYVVDVPH